jgi:hypothetical protein
MSTIPRGYVANHKFWDRMGRITPNVEWSESDRPHFEGMPAPWLPVQRYEQEIEAWYTVSSGKAVGLDREGHLVPAGLRVKWCVATSTASLVYTDNDVGLVYDLTTGALVTAAVSYTEDEVTLALRSRGLIKTTERAMDFISKPIGIASYNYFKASGTDHFNPRTLIQHNFRPQALAAVTCDYVITLPVLPALATAEATANALLDGASDLDAAFDTTRTKGWFGSTAIAGSLRYASEVTAGDDVVCYLTTNFPLAHITDESPMTWSTGTMTNEVDSISAISALGDFFVDHEVGVIFMFETDGNAIPTGMTTSTTVTYYHYGAEGTGTNTVSTFACATGNLEFGDFLACDKNSNFVKAAVNFAATGRQSSAAGTPFSTDPDYSNAADADISAQIEGAIEEFVEGIIGQVIGVVEYPRANLDRVNTAYLGQTAANMRTPGSATGGRSDQLTYANAAERMVIVNLIAR